MKPKGKHSVKVCLGTACYVKRAEEILDKLRETLNIDVGEVTLDKKFSLESVRCLGACGLAPVVVVVVVVVVVIVRSSDELMRCN